MEIECEKCGEVCEVEEHERFREYVAWCDECNDYATTTRDVAAEMLADAIDQEMDRRKYEGFV